MRAARGSGCAFRLIVVACDTLAAAALLSVWHKRTRSPSGVAAPDATRFGCDPTLTCHLTGIIPSNSQALPRGDPIVRRRVTTAASRASQPQARQAVALVARTSRELMSCFVQHGNIRRAGEAPSEDPTPSRLSSTATALQHSGDADGAQLRELPDVCPMPINLAHTCHRVHSSTQR